MTSSGTMLYIQSSYTHYLFIPQYKVHSILLLKSLKRWKCYVDRFCCKFRFCHDKQLCRRHPTSIVITAQSIHIIRFPKRTDIKTQILRTLSAGFFKPINTEATSARDPDESASCRLFVIKRTTNRLLMLTIQESTPSARKTNDLRNLQQNCKMLTFNITG